jgi:hypothetical protein
VVSLSMECVDQVTPFVSAVAKCWNFEPLDCQAGECKTLGVCVAEIKGELH